MSSVDSSHAENNRRKKITYGWSNIAISLIFGVGFCFGDAIGDVYSTVQLYYMDHDGNNQNDTIDCGSTIHHQDGKSSTLYFGFSISFFVIFSFYISSKSILIYWREEREKLTYFKPLQMKSLWTSFRWLCHFPFLAAPAARYYKIPYIRVIIVYDGFQTRFVTFLIQYPIFIG